MHRCVRKHPRKVDLANVQMEEASKILSHANLCITQLLQALIGTLAVARGGGGAYQSVLWRCRETVPVQSSVSTPEPSAALAEGCALASRRQMTAERRSRDSAAQKRQPILSVTLAVN
jgi:hypothetical protein